STFPTWDALRTDPMPNTMVQKMIGPIIILIRFTNAVPITARPAASFPKIRPTAVPATTATITATYNQWVLIFFRVGSGSTDSSGSGGGGFSVVIGLSLHIDALVGSSRLPSSGGGARSLMSSEEMSERSGHWAVTCGALPTNGAEDA